MRYMPFKHNQFGTAVGSVYGSQAEGAISQCLKFPQFCMKILTQMDLSEAEHSVENVSGELPLDTENTFRDFSSTEDMHNAFTEELTSSIGEVSSHSLSCMNSIREYEECLGTGRVVDGDYIGDSLGDLLSSCNNSNTRHCSSKMDSDDSTKRHKSDTQDQSLVVELQDTVHGDSLSFVDGKTLSDLKMDVNGDILVDKHNFDKCTKMSGSKTAALEGKDSEMKIGFVKSLVLSLSAASQGDISTIDSDELANGQMGYLPCLHGDARGSVSMKREQSIHRGEVDSGSQENTKNFNLNLAVNIGEAGSKTCCVDKPSEHYKYHLKCLKKDDHWVRLHGTVLNQIDSGFVTGNNKKILVDPSKITLLDDSKPSAKTMFRANSENSSNTGDKTPLNLSVDGGSRAVGHNNASTRSMHVVDGGLAADIDSESCIDGPRKSMEAIVRPSLDKPAYSKSIPEAHRDCRGVCLSEETESDPRMMDIFRNVRKYFKHCEHGWVFEQFKWTWLHLFSGQMCENGNLESEVVDMMNLRLKNEHSVLRRIVEFDDVPFRFMVLGVIRVEEDSVELYDGFYSLKFEIDKNVYAMLKMFRCDLGSKLYIFGSDILVKKPTSIFEVQGNALRLHYNGTRVCNDDVRLGKARCVSFLNNISRLVPDGGVVSAIVVRIKKIIELKHLVTVENYRSSVDDLEKEIEKIYKIAEKASYTVDPKDIVVRRFCKMTVGDESGECVLTWWSPPELKVSETYKLVYLTPVRNSLGLHLSTSKKTYFERVG